MMFPATVNTFIYLIAAHFLCDFALQGDYMARVKKPYAFPEWGWALSGHAIIHGAAVTWILGNLFLGLAEMFVHLVTDAVKCQDRISYHTDQWIHLISKCAWLALALLYPM